jgi:hypothetical protein
VPQGLGDITTSSTAIFSSTLARAPGYPSAGAGVDQLDNVPITAVGGWKQWAAPWYSDQILPFDITISAANELGAAACAKLYGVEILNEGYGISIDDSVSEMQATFVARGITPLAVWRKHQQQDSKTRCRRPSVAGSHWCKSLPKTSRLHGSSLFLHDLHDKRGWQKPGSIRAAFSGTGTDPGAGSETAQ